MGMEEEDEELKKLMWLKKMGVITPLGWWKGSNMSESAAT